jgi:Ca-activated chloride channel family protein
MDQSPSPKDEKGSDPHKESQGASTANAKDKDQEEKGKGEKKGQAESALLENRLNRLEDKPGMGMMPVIQKRTIERDW